MHFCPQEAMLLIGLFTTISTSFSFLGWWIRGLFKKPHIHCEEDENCNLSGVNLTKAVKGACN